LLRHIVGSCKRSKHAALREDLLDRTFHIPPSVSVRGCGLRRLIAAACTKMHTCMHADERADAQDRKKKRPCRTSRHSFPFLAPGNGGERLVYIV
jgi:hypothetical protein